MAARAPQRTPMEHAPRGLPVHTETDTINALSSRRSLRVNRPSSRNRTSTHRTPRLRPLRIPFYAGCTWVLIHAPMQRLTARLLLLFALAGILVPVALAASPAPVRACCLRMAHHCHEMAASDSKQTTFRVATHCNCNCCHAVITSQWAHPQPRMTALFARTVASLVAASHPTAPAARLFSSRSTRAPPQLSIA